MLICIFKNWYILYTISIDVIIICVPLGVKPTIWWRIRARSGRSLISIMFLHMSVIRNHQQARTHEILQRREKCHIDWFLHVSSYACLRKHQQARTQDFRQGGAGGKNERKVSSKKAPTKDLGVLINTVSFKLVTKLNVEFEQLNWIKIFGSGILSVPLVELFVIKVFISMYLPGLQSD